MVHSRCGDLESITPDLRDRETVGKRWLDVDANWFSFAQRSGETRDMVCLDRSMPMDSREDAGIHGVERMGAGRRLARTVRSPFVDAPVVRWRFEAATRRP